MNLLEHYIVKVHSFEEVKCNLGTFIEVDLTYNCYGNVERRKTSFLKEEWEEALEKGYYFA